MKISKNRLNKFDVGPAIRAYISGCIDACKCTEIFRINVHSRVSNGSESNWLKLCTNANQIAHQI